MNILQKLRQALINAGWIRGVDTKPIVPDFWPDQGIYTGVPKATALADIAWRRSALKDDLERAKRQKKPRKHIYAALARLTEAELRIEGGK